MSARKGKPSSTYRPFFNAHWSLEDVRKGLELCELIKGNIRINQRNYEESFIDNPDGPTDICIFGMKERNRALHGDVVVVKLKPKSEWRVSEDYNLVLGANQVQKSIEESKPVGTPQTPKIDQNKSNGVMKKPKFELDEELIKRLKQIGIYRDEDEIEGQNSSKDKVKSPPAVNSTPNGKKTYLRVSDFHWSSEIPEEFIQKTAERNINFALFSPSDSRIPRLRIPMKECPANFLERADDFKNILFVAKITDWPENGIFAQGTLQKILGEVGDLDAETEGLLMQYDIKSEEFAPRVLACLPEIPEGGWTIPQEEFAYRKDFRNELIFTIDPATARDLDDALHVKPLEEGWFEVGVHIADVSYFVPTGTALDDAAEIRGNSCYLVHKVIPMLPRLLCEELCSLNPGVERLSFSVVWEMNELGEIRGEWFGRSVIKSCCQLNYDIAQGFINEGPDRVWRMEELPKISDGKSPEEICEAVLRLNKIAKNLRQKRFDHGALRLDQPKLSFILDSDKRTPLGCAIYDIKDSNRLIEEFMLLANMAVARKIYSAYPQLAVLRRHPVPKQKILKENADICASMGYPVNISNSKTLNDSIVAYLGRPHISDEEKAAVTVMIQLMSRSMVLALYFCTGVLKEESQFAHFALSVPLYTHFTSPIRRYPDVMVHRLLAAALEYVDEPKLEPTEVQKICNHCNKAKVDAKTVSDLSAEMFFAMFIRECGPVETRGVVMNIFDRSFDVLLVKFGLVKRVYCELSDLEGWNFIKGPPPVMDLIWKTSDQRDGHPDRILLFSIVDLVLVKGSEPLKYQALLKPFQKESGGEARLNAAKLVSV